METEGFLIYKLQVDLGPFMLTFSPTKVKNDTTPLCTKTILVDKKEVILHGAPCANNTILASFPFIYLPHKLLEDIQAIENAMYQLEVHHNYTNDHCVMPPLHGSAYNAYTMHKEFETENGSIQYGTISWLSYVGKSSLHVIYGDEKVEQIPIEVRAKKIDYLDDYKQMVDEVTEKIGSILWDEKSPISLRASKQVSEKPSLLEMFFYIKTIMLEQNIPTYWKVISSNPRQAHFNSRSSLPISDVSNIDADTIYSIINSPSEQRLFIPSISNGQSYLPETLNVPINILTYDTPENRFLKFWYEEMINILESIRTEFGEKTLVAYEASLFISELEQILMHTIFQNISTSYFVDTGNPVLRRRPGYVETYRYYEISNELGKLAWDDYEDLLFNKTIKPVYDIYEYWVFFKLINALSLITTDDVKYQLTGTNKLKLRSCTVRYNDLTIKLSYQKSHRYSKKALPHTSYSLRMVPDYTLSVWNNKIFLGSIVFDAKYKYDTLSDIFDATEEKKDDERTVKRVDLITMHAYKDSLRNTLGSYVLFPGKKCDIKLFCCNEKDDFPSIGALPLYPFNSSSENASIILQQTNNLKEFIIKAVSYISK